MNEAVFNALKPFLRNIRSISVYYTDDESGATFSVDQPMAIVSIDWYGIRPDGFTITETDELKVIDKEQSLQMKIMLHNIKQQKQLLKFFRENTNECRSYPPMGSMSYQFY